MHFDDQEDVTKNLVIETHLVTGSFADLHKATNRVSRETMLMWVASQPVELHSMAAKSFIDRLELLQAIKPPVAPLLAHGIDAAGFGFALLPNLDGNIVSEGNLAMSEAERRFVACLRIVGRIHAANLYCGDITNSSFWVNRIGEIDFIGVLGAELAIGNASRANVNDEGLSYLPPEYFSGGRIDSRSDVYSLGVLGYLLFTKELPDTLQSDNSMQAESDGITPVADLVQFAPAWADEVLLCCLNRDPAERYQDASQVLQAIIRAREIKSAMQMAPALLPDAEAKKKQSQPERSLTVTAPIVTKSTAKPAKFSFGMQAVIIASVAIVCTLGFIFGNWLVNKQPEQTATDDLPIDLVFQGNEYPQLSLEQILQLLESETQTETKKMHYIVELQGSDDPLAHNALVRVSVGGIESELRNEARRILIERGRRQGLILSSEQTRQWLRSIANSEQNSQQIEQILTVIEISVPLEERLKLLRSAYTTFPDLIIKLAAALAFDLDQLNDFQPLLSQLIGDKLEMENANEFSALALIMADAELALIFEDKINQRRDQLTDRDIPWLVELLGKRLDVNVRSVANIAINRNLLNPLQTELVKLVRDRPDLKAETVAILINVAMGKIELDDIKILGRWYDASTELILLSILAQTDDPLILTEAFDTLSGKSPTRQPAAALIRWIRTNVWEQRANLAKAVGVLGVHEFVDSEQQKIAYTAFAPFLKMSELVDIIVGSEAAELVVFVLKQHADRVTLNRKLNLLRHKNKQIRMAAVDSIHTNDVGALKMVVDSYELEKDSEVRERYKKFWVIGNR